MNRMQVAGSPANQPARPVPGYHPTLCPGCGCWVFTPEGQSEPRQCFACRWARRKGA